MVVVELAACKAMGAVDETKQESFNHKVITAGFGLASYRHTNACFVRAYFKLLGTTASFMPASFKHTIDGFMLPSFKN